MNEQAKNHQQGLEEVLDQHRELRGLISELKAFLEKPRPEVGEMGSHTWASEMAAMLTRLHDKVFRHFRHEEGSGFLDEIAVRRPSALRAVENLRQDHDRILGDFRSLVGAAMVYSEGKNPVSPRLRQWANSILDRLDRHEREETDLFQRIHYEDLGSAD
jgi:hypothetical protein